VVPSLHVCERNEEGEEEKRYTHVEKKREKMIRKKRKRME
jgi:hypothetical protein